MYTPHRHTKQWRKHGASSPQHDAPQDAEKDENSTVNFQQGDRVSTALNATGETRVPPHGKFS
ncbi:hypothetical protein P4N68_07810 [Corynebacterium felinum]|uniref:Uncharacterized protein n=1 Tax=Corynebacterium felinum TaxID=131318 RepID=A0ABU2B7Z7_9CORY|nr:hypothetical protein [Corynebacterium felinum]MDF5820983.1 hypothetical protein [Corynebacterium felinum]MDR7354728.1 hypothetical protein [Corynebacterium felinum]